MGMNLRAGLGWLLEDDPLWYHASVGEGDVRVPDGELDEVLERLAEIGFTELEQPSFVDFAPGVIVDEFGCYHACRHKLYHGFRNGAQETILLSPIRKRYLT